MTDSLSEGFGIESVTEVRRFLAVGASFCIFPWLLLWLLAYLVLFTHAGPELVVLVI